MATGRCAYNEIVAEPLTMENQEAWFLWVKNFLIARDLWEVVQGLAKPDEDPVSWRRKNAEALHIMQISCTPESSSHIMKIFKAKAAWDILKRKYAYRPSMPPQETEEENVDFDVKILYKAICKNEWDAAQTFVGARSNVWNAKLTSTGKTALHVAAQFGHAGIVEKLVTLVSPKLLEEKDSFDRTPLFIAAYTGVVQVAKCMVNKNRSILSISTRNGRLPVTMAFSSGHEEMARYLYSVTPLEVLKPDKGPQGPKLLHYCFYSRDLDVALDLLQKCEELLLELDHNEWTPILGIAAMPSAFSSGSQLIFWKRWIYNCIHIQSTTITNDVHVYNQQQDQSRRGHGKHIPSTTTTNDVPADIEQQDQGRRVHGKHIPSTTTANDVPADIEQQDQSRRVHGLRLGQRLISYNFFGMKEIYKLKLFHESAAQILSLVCKKVSDSPMANQVVNIVKDALFRAAREGNVKFVVEVVKANPDLILYTQQGSSWDIFFFAVRYRQAEVFNLIHGLRFKKALMFDCYRNSLLHVAGMLAPSSQLNRIPGAALQMQRELQWFKEVENVVPPSVKLSENNYGKQAEEIFKESHKELRKEGEEWIKRTASSCSVVGALVVTIMFAAAFTVPGGNNQESGYPIFLEKKLFMFFIVSDALSLFSSATSVLIFLGILTSRYLEEDFLKSLPTKLIIGLSSLFLSIATMMIAFSATILIMLEHRQSWSLLPIIMLASVPVTIFVWLQFPLLVQIIKSTYCPSIFYRDVKPWP